MGQGYLRMDERQFRILFSLVGGRKIKELVMGVFCHVFCLVASSFRFDILVHAYFFIFQVGTCCNYLQNYLENAFQIVVVK
jgi:hypothetical protein